MTLSSTSTSSLYSGTNPAYLKPPGLSGITNPSYAVPVNPATGIAVQNDTTVSLPGVTLAGASTSGYSSQVGLTLPPSTVGASMTGTPALNVPASAMSVAATASPSTSTTGTASTTVAADAPIPNMTVTASPSQPSAVSTPNSPRVATPSTPTQQVNQGTAPTSAAPSAPSTAGQSTTTNSADIQALLQKFLSTTSDNPLNSHWQVAYHWQLFCMSDIDIYTQAKKPTSVSALYTAIDGLNKIVIAESGVTTYNIKSVEMKSLVGPNSETRNINASQFTIVIIEPIGVGFLDAMKEAAYQCKVRNLQYAPYFLQLSFKAYNEQTGAFEADALANAGLDQSRWIWSIIINNIETHFDEKGGMYTISALPFSDNLLDGQDILTAPQAITASGGTIAAYFDDLATNLTNAWRIRNGFQSITYKFVVHDLVEPPPSISNVKVGSYKMKPLQPDNASMRIRNFAGGFQTIFSPGTVITDMIDWPLANNEQIQNLGLDRDNTGTQTDQSTQHTNDRKFKESIIFRVESDTEITDYDYWNGVYVRTVTFHLFPYYTQALIASVIQRNDARDPQVQATMLTRLLERGLLKKNYQYLYTGLNTEVYNMEIKSNFRWAALLPKLEGARLDGNNVEATAKTTDDQVKPGGNINEVADIKDKLAKLQDQLSKADARQNGVAAKIADVRSKIQTPIPDAVTSAISVIENPQASSAARADAQNTINNAFPKLGDLYQRQQEYIANSTALHDTLTRLQNSQLGIGGTQSPSGKTVYAEDLIVSNTGNVLNTEFDYMNFNYCIPFRQAYKDAQQEVGTGVTGSYHRDRSVFGSLIQQLYLPLTTELAGVDLDIRGDPYWIGSSNLARLVPLRQGVSTAGTQSFSKNLPNWMAGDQTFLFTFRYPIVIGDDFKPVFRNDDSFVALYRATSIISTFADGVFKQKLHGVIYPFINVINALSNVQNVRPAPATQRGNTSAPRPTTTTQARPVRTTAASQQRAQDFKTALMAAAQARGLNLTDTQIDGIVANAERETGGTMDNTLHITDTNGLPAAGLLMWNGPRYQNFYNNEGVYPQDATIQQQADYTMKELSGQAGSGYSQKSTYTALAATTTPEQATLSFLTTFEKGPTQSIQSNLNKSMGFYPNMYGPGNPGSPN